MTEIVQDGAPILRDVAPPLPEHMFGSVELKRIIADMEEALDHEVEGVALAAPQIDVPYRIFIVRTDRTLPPVVEDEDPTTTSRSQGRSTKSAPAPEVDVYINPEIVKTSRKRSRADEGCLSVRGFYGVTNRHERVTVRARRIDGYRFERGASGILAQIFEHEIDHLNGILFIDNAENIVHLQHATVA